MRFNEHGTETKTKLRWIYSEGITDADTGRKVLALANTSSTT